MFSRLILLVALALTLITVAYPQDDSCWGSQKPCADGQYRGPDGSIQPATCATHEGDTHPCECERAKMCNGGGPNSTQLPGAKCKTYCRSSACSCVTPGCS